MGGKIEKVEYWGVKSLAYRINKNRKAHFTLLNIDAPAAAIAEMERQSGLNEDVIRFLTVRVEALEQGQSAMMRKRDDDDRGERGDRPDGANVAAPRVPTAAARRQRDESRQARAVSDDNRSRAPQALLSPPQNMSLLGSECAKNRL